MSKKCHAWGADRVVTLVTNEQEKLFSTLNVFAKLSRGAALILKKNVHLKSTINQLASTMFHIAAFNLHQGECLVPEIDLWRCVVKIL